MSQQIIDDLEEIIESLQRAQRIIEDNNEYDFAIDSYLKPLSAHAGNLSIAVDAQAKLIEETK